MGFFLKKFAFAFVFFLPGIWAGAQDGRGHEEQKQRAKAPKLGLGSFPKVELAFGDIFENKPEIESLVSELKKTSPILDWTTIFELPTRQIWSCQKGKLVSRYGEAKALLKSFPEKLREWELSAKHSMSFWEALGQSEVPSGYADDIAHQYPITPAAERALCLLVYKFHHKGEQAVASLYADQLLGDFPIGEQSDALLFLLAEVYDRTSQTEKVANLQAEAARRGEKTAELLAKKLKSNNDPDRPIPKQDIKSKFLQLALSKDPVKRELFLRLARAMDPKDLSKKLGLQPDDPIPCIILALNSTEEASALEIARLKTRLGVPFVDALPHFEFVQIKPGKFRMGSPDGTTKDKEGNVIPPEAGQFGGETPHEVEISKAFWMQKNEVTQLQYEAVMGENPSNFTSPNNPVETVSWSDAQKFIEKLNQLDPHHTYRLPTEAEWEYAARAGTDTAYSFGNDSKDLSEHAVYAAPESPASGPQKVANRKPNAFGLYDMHGNVGEWVQDGYTDKPPSGVDPVVVASGSYHVIRGGGWDRDAQRLRSAYRSRYYHSGRDDGLGFRLVRTPK